MYVFRYIKFVIFISFLCLYSIKAYSESINYKTLYKNAAPAVVLIHGISGKSVAKGTGSIITDSGLIITNAHVATNEGGKWENLLITFKPDQVTGGDEDLKKNTPAKLIYADVKRDLALIVPSKKFKGLPHLDLSDLNKVGIGEPVVAIGHPGGGQKWTLTTGRISASWISFKGIKGWDLFQTETALNPGNSGGPLLGGDGSIVGVNTFVVRNNDKISLEGLNYAIKSTTVRKWIAQWLSSLESNKKNDKKKQPLKNKRINPVPVPKVLNNNPITVSPLKKSKRKYKSAIKPGVQVTESQLLTAFLDDTEAELGIDKKKSKSKHRKTVNNGEKGFDTFLESIYD